MKILAISNYYPPYELGGYEQLCRDVVVRLAERGNHVEVLTCDRGANLLPARDEPHIHRELHIQPNFESRLGMIGQFFLTRRRDEAHNLRCLEAHAAHIEPDVIFIWNLQGVPRSIALAAEAVRGSGVAYWLGGYSPAEPDEFWLYWHSPARRSIIGPIKSVLTQRAITRLRTEGKPERPRLKHAGVVSEYMRQKHVTDNTLPTSARVIYNGVELDLFQQQVRVDFTGPLQLLQAGRVSADKGVHTSIEALGRLAPEFTADQIQLTVAGSGPADYLARLQKIASDYGVADRVTFSGWLPREQLPALMARSQVLLLPTIHQEPFARVVLEAMASGLTVIGALTGGTSEIVQHNVTGLTFPAEDAAELARQIKRLHTDPALRVRLATRGQELVYQNFSLDRMVDRIEQLLAEAAEDRNP